MSTATWAFIGFIVATFAASIPGVRTQRPTITNPSFSEKTWFYIKKNKKIIGIAGGMLGAIAALLSSAEQDKAQDLLVKKSDTIAVLSQRMLNLQTSASQQALKHYDTLLNKAILQLDKSSIVINEERLNGKKTEKIARLQSLLQQKNEYLQRVFLGTDVFGYTMFSQLVGKQVGLTFINESDTPVDELNINIVRGGESSVLTEQQAKEQLALGNPDPYFTSIFHKKIDHLPVYTKFTFHQLGDISFSYPKDSLLIIKYRSKGRHWSQIIKHKVVKGELTGTSVVITDVPFSDGKFHKVGDNVMSQTYTQTLKAEFDIWESLVRMKIRPESPKIKPYLGIYRTDF